MKFIYIADTHIGAAPMEFTQQKGYPEKIPTLVELLEKHIKENDVSFVLHGGDMLDSASVENINSAKELFGSLSVPVYLCLGNHDLTEDNAIMLWKEHGSVFFGGDNTDFTISEGNLRLHVITTHWEEKPFYWGTKQNAHFLLQQSEEIVRKIESEPDAVHLVCTHSPVIPILPEQTGFDKGIHATGDAIKDLVFDILKDRPQIKAVISAHNHVNTHSEINGVHFVTVSSFSETPFEFKLFELTDTSLSMETISLEGEVEFKTEYNFNNTFVQGRAKDRTFNITL